MIKLTSAKLRAGRVEAPAKITSSIPPPRIAVGRFSPMTQRNASSRLDLPQPFGPTTPVSPSAITKSVGSTKLLKPFNLSREKRKACPLGDSIHAHSGTPTPPTCQRHTTVSAPNSPLIHNILRKICKIHCKTVHKSERNLPFLGRGRSESPLLERVRTVTTHRHGSPLRRKASGIKWECGTGQPNSGSKTAAAPATVSGERPSLSHWETGKATVRVDPQARRPAVQKCKPLSGVTGKGE